MPAIAQIGPLTTLLEFAATSIGAGVIVGGFLAGGAGMLAGRTRKEMEDNALREAFRGGLVGILCLCIDLLLR
jgi:hypothetical protein